MNTMSTSAAMEFGDIAMKFGAFHKVHSNILIHAITTPLGILGFLSVIMRVFESTTFAVTLVACYVLLLLPALTIGVWILTLAICISLILISRRAEFSVRTSLLLVCASYLCQDLSHWLCNESTFQASYSDGGQVDFTNLHTWSEQFLQHCVYLLPLCIDLILPRRFPVPFGFMGGHFPASLHPLSEILWYFATAIFFTIGNYNLDSKNNLCFFPGAPYYCRIVKTNVIAEGAGCSQKNNLAIIRKWAMSQNPPSDTSTHFWYQSLPSLEKASFHAVANCHQMCEMFRSLFSEKHYCLEVIEGMNEVYVTGPSRNEENMNSDQIFYTEHVDGPYGFIPFVSVFRCIVGMDKNCMTTTRFPMNPHVDIHACEGDVVGFDFNREVHYITRDETRRQESDEYRVTLKVHYVLYPRVLAPLGKLVMLLNVNYNLVFRALFLKTLNPKSLYEHFLAWNVVVNTAIFNNFERYIGTRNVLFLASALIASWVTGDYEIFLYLTSFVHYFRYIGTYFSRSGIDFGSFKRDVFFFKNVALLQLFYLLFSSILSSGGDAETPLSFSNFVHNFTRNVDIYSILMILGGYGISIKATAALGIDRTYFGYELGYCDPIRIFKFPYGYIPHPMILGQVVALYGIYRIPCFRDEWPVLVPIHIALYVIHMLQENFNIYDAPGKQCI